MARFGNGNPETFVLRTIEHLIDKNKTMARPVKKTPRPRKLKNDAPVSDAQDNELRRYCIDTVIRLGPDADMGVILRSVDTLRCYLKGEPWPNPPVVTYTYNPPINVVTDPVGESKMYSKFPDAHVL